MDPHRTCMKVQHLMLSAYPVAGIGRAWLLKIENVGGPKKERR